MTNNLIHEGLNSLNLRQKLAEFTQLYIADNQVLHQLFFYKLQRPYDLDFEQ